MAIAAPRPHFRFDLDHAEQLFRGISNLALPPARNFFFFAFPMLRAFSTGHVELRDNDPAQNGMLPPEPKALILREIEHLSALAGIQRKVAAYSALSHAFSSAGGAHSLTAPALFLPHQHLFRPGKSPFTQEQPEDNLAGELWNYTDDETRFFICRELSQIKKSNALIRIAAKVCFLAAVFVFYTLPFGFLSGGALMGISLALFLHSEKKFEAQMDIRGAHLLGRRLNDPARAVRAAISALEKQIRQNLARKNENRLCRLYISRMGNNPLDLFHSFLTTRIARLRRLLA